MWRGGRSNEDELLTSCYRTALSLADTHALASIAFPAISTGVYRFPQEQAARIAVGTVVSELSAARDSAMQHVIFCCFGDPATEPYQDAFAELGLA